MINIRISNNNLAVFFTFVAFLAALMPGCESIGCYRCVSINGSNPKCHDPFSHDIHQFYAQDCHAVVTPHLKEYHNDTGMDTVYTYYPGKYQSFFCVKIYYSYNSNPWTEHSNQDVYIRDCSTMDLGTARQGIGGLQMIIQDPLGTQGNMIYLNYSRNAFMKTCSKDGCNGCGMHVPSVIIIMLALMATFGAYLIQE